MVQSKHNTIGVKIFLTAFNLPPNFCIPTPFPQGTAIVRAALRGRPPRLISTLMERSSPNPQILIGNVRAALRGRPPSFDFNLLIFNLLDRSP